MPIAITLKDDEGDSVQSAGGGHNTVGHQNPLPVAKDYLTQIVYDANNNPIYVGKAMPGSDLSAAVWQIKKITYDGNNNPISIQWASGVMTFTQIWSNYSSLNYS